MIFKITLLELVSVTQRLLPIILVNSFWSSVGFGKHSGSFFFFFFLSKLKTNVPATSMRDWSIKCIRTQRQHTDLSSAGSQSQKQRKVWLLNVLPPWVCAAGSRRTLRMGEQKLLTVKWKQRSPSTGPCWTWKSYCCPSCSEVVLCQQAIHKVCGYLDTVCVVCTDVHQHRTARSSVVQRGVMGVSSKNTIQYEECVCSRPRAGAI